MELQRKEREVILDGRHVIPDGSDKFGDKQVRESGCIRRFAFCVSPVLRVEPGANAQTGNQCDTQ